MLGDFCVERMYWSWMTIVVGTINVALIGALGVHILSSFIGTTFMGAAQQQAAQGFGGRSEQYIDETVSQSNINLNQED